MHSPLQRSLLPGVENHIGLEEEQLVGIHGRGWTGKQTRLHKKTLAVFVVGGVVGGLLVHQSLVALAMGAVIFNRLQDRTWYALVLTDVSALIVRLGRNREVQEATRFAPDAFPDTRAWTTDGTTQIRIELDPPLSIVKPKLLNKEHSINALLEPLGIDASNVDLTQQRRRRIDINDF
ncbi:MAG: hypothetical protein ACI81R_002435 [Bradymonadia bacterium]|jgi:hypothetical protein